MQNILKNKIDVKGGKFSYGQRIALGQLFEIHKDDPNEIAIFKGVFKILHETDIKLTSNLHVQKLILYLQDILAGLEYWIEREKELSYTPTPEEKAAGIASMAEKLGSFGTLKSLAEKYSKDPDEILQWEYAKVFNLLRADFEEAMFRRRLEKVHENKRKQKSNRWKQ